MSRERDTIRSVNASGGLAAPGRQRRTALTGFKAARQAVCPRGPIGAHGAPARTPGLLCRLLSRPPPVDRPPRGRREWVLVSDTLSAVKRPALGRLLGCMVAVAVALALAPAAASAATWHRCPAYRVVQTIDGYTAATRVYDLRAQRVSCRQVRNVLHKYFFGHTRQAGPLPSDGVRVGHWVMALRMNVAWGDHGHQRFRGKYTVS